MKHASERSGSACRATATYPKLVAVMAPQGPRCGRRTNAARTRRRSARDRVQPGPRGSARRVRRSPPRDRSARPASRTAPVSRTGAADCSGASPSRRSPPSPAGLRIERLVGVGNRRPAEPDEEGQERENGEEHDACGRHGGLYTALNHASSSGVLRPAGGLAALGLLYCRMARVVAVVGASRDRRKFGNKAVRAFRRRGYEVVPITPGRRRHRGPAGLFLGSRRRRPHRPRDRLSRTRGRGISHGGDRSAGGSRRSG